MAETTPVGISANYPLGEQDAIDVQVSNGANGQIASNLAAWWILRFVGATADWNMNFACTQGSTYVFINDTAGAATLRARANSLSSIVLAPGEKVFVAASYLPTTGSVEFREIPESGTNASGTIVVPTRAALQLLPATSNKLVWVEEVHGFYYSDPASSQTVNGWTVLTSPIGHWNYSSAELTLPILGNGQDDWPNFATAGAACASPTPSRSVILRLGPGTYTCLTRQNIASFLYIRLTSETKVASNIAPNIDNLDSPFCGQGLNVLGANTTVSVQSFVGQNQLTLTADIGLTTGDFFCVYESAVSFRCAIYQVKSFNAGTGVVKLDRALVMICGATGAQLLTTSFPVGAFVQKVIPAQNITVEFNGAVVYGACNRFGEFIRAWKCRFIGPFFFGDGSAVTATERIMSLDSPSYYCGATDGTADGGQTTLIGFSVESGEENYYSRCVSNNSGGVGFTFQDGVNCYAEDCQSNNSVGEGVIFTAAGGVGGNVLGSDGCRWIRGSSNSNGASGFKFERGASRCSIEGASSIGNTGDGVVVAASGATWRCYGNAVRGKSVIRKNTANGIELQSSSDGTVICGGVQVNDNPNGITTAVGAGTTFLSEVDLSRNTTGAVFATDVNMSQVVCIPSAGIAQTQLTITAGRIVASNCQFQCTSNGVIGFSISGTGELDASGGSSFVTANGGIAVGVSGSGTFRATSDCRLQAAGGGFSVYVTTATACAFIGAGITNSGTYDTNGGVGIYNFGTFQLNDVNAIPISFPRALATDVPQITRITAGAVPAAGTPVMTTTAGVGFTATGVTAAATAQFAWRIG